MDIEWATDEFGNRHFEFEGWRVTLFPDRRKPTILGTGSVSSVEFDIETGELEIEAEAEYDGTFYYYIPAPILWIAMNYPKIPTVVEAAGFSFSLRVPSSKSPHPKGHYEVRRKFDGKTIGKVWQEDEGWCYRLWAFGGGFTHTGFRTRTDACTTLLAENVKLGKGWDD